MCCYVPDALHTAHYAQILLFKIWIKIKADSYMPCEAMAHSTKFQNWPDHSYIFWNRQTVTWDGAGLFSWSILFKCSHQWTWEQMSFWLVALSHPVETHMDPNMACWNWNTCRYGSGSPVSALVLCVNLEGWVTCHAKQWPTPTSFIWHGWDVQTDNFWTIGIQGIYLECNKLY
jgi:hypothetical protein